MLLMPYSCYFDEGAIDTVCFLKTVPSAACVVYCGKDIYSRYIYILQRVYTEGTVFMSPAVILSSPPGKVPPFPFASMDQ